MFYLCKTMDKKDTKKRAEHYAPLLKIKGTFAEVINVSLGKPKKEVKPKNNKDSGVIELLVYKEGESFVGVCLTFDIVEEGSNPSDLIETYRICVAC